MSDSKEFRNSLRFPLKDQPTEEEKKRIIKEYKNKMLERFNSYYEDPAIRNYFNHIIAAIMIAQYQNYEQFGINIPYRYKARNSTRNKVESRLRNATIHYSDDGKVVLDNMQPLNDIFAMKIVSRRRPPIVSSDDPQIQEYIEEQKNNRGFLERMQKFRSSLMIDDNGPKKASNYKYECSKIEYYEKCKEILTKLKEIVDPKATKLIKYYDGKIDDIESCLEFLRASHTNDEPDALITEEDLTNSNFNFFDLLKEFEGKYYNKCDLEILTKQVCSLFNSNPTFEKLGIRLSDNPVEKKRTENGFESNFIYLDTLLGKIECQLQTENQYRFGNFGFAAHTKLKGKRIHPVAIPVDIKDKEKIKEFREAINAISPDSFLARMDDNELGRVMILEFGSYQNYSNVISQIAKGDPSESFLYAYRSKAYALKDVLFDKEEHSLGFIEADIQRYLNSEEFRELQSKYQVQEKIEATTKSPISEEEAR